MILKRLGEIFFHPVFHEFLSFLFCWSCVFSLFCTDVPLRLFARLLSKLACWGYFKKHYVIFFLSPCKTDLFCRIVILLVVSAD